MQNAAPVQLRQIRDFGQLIATTFTFLKQNWRPLFRAIGTLCVPVALVAGFFAGDSLAAMQQMNMTPSADPTAIFSRLGRTVTTLIPAYILLMFAFLLLVAIVHEYIRAYDKSEHVGITTGDLWRRTWPQLGSYFGASFLSSLLALVAVVLCFLPSLYVIAVLALTFTCHAVERTGGAGSLSRSNQLVKGDFWPTLGLVLIIGLINAIVNVPAQIPVAMVTNIYTMNSMVQTLQGGEPAELPRWFGMFMSIATAVQWSLMMLSYPIIAVCLALKYFSRIEEKEAPSLREKIQGFEQA
ncbi:MAG: hypothetical protein ABI432_11715 [Flavobacteriales bacterium]